MTLQSLLPQDGVLTHLGRLELGSNPRKLPSLDEEGVKTSPLAEA